MPSLNLDLIHDKEKDAARSFNHLVELSRWVTEFRSGLALFDYCLGQESIAHSASDTDKARQFFGWRQIAARDCAMCVYHFGCVRDGIIDMLRYMPTLNNHLDGHNLRVAKTIFRQSFAWYDDLRQAIAHSAERSNTMDAKKKHSVRGPKDIPGTHIGGNVVGGDTFLLDQSLVGRKYSGMWKGQIYSIEVSVDTAEKLNNVKDKYLEIFAPFTIEEGPPTVTVSSVRPEGITVIDLTRLQQ